MPRTKNAKRKSERLSPSQNVDSDDESVEQYGGLEFSQQAPELSQPIFPVKPTEQKNLDNLPSEAREKHLMDLSRMILFKALAGEPIDRLKVCKEAGIKGEQGKISTAAFAEAAERLQNVFGFELKRIPKFMENSKSVGKKYKDRLFVVNDVGFSADHSKEIHAVHAESAIQKGFLMLVLALVFCKGEPRSDGSRWILDADLYRILNSVDENIPAEPPAQGARKKQQGPSRRLSQEDGGALTPDVDTLLDKYVHLDYIMKEKTPDDRAHLYPNAEENSFLYALGPRAAIEIGRKQIVYFCAEILDQEPDPTMLLELEGDELGNDIDDEAEE